MKVLGEGSYGMVYLMRHKEERRLYCMKVIKIRNIPKKVRPRVCSLPADNVGL